MDNAKAVQTVVGINDVICPIAGTAVKLTSYPTTRGFYLSAPLKNVGNIFIGGPNVTNSTGSPTQSGINLAPGGMTDLLPIADPALLYINADNNGDKVSILLI